MLDRKKVTVFLDKAFDKMTTMVGAPKDIVNSSETWFREYTWTTKQQQEFKKWFIKEFRKTFPRQKEFAEREFKGFDFMWGWKIKEEK